MLRIKESRGTDMRNQRRTVLAKPMLNTMRTLLLAGSLVSLLQAADPALVGDVYVSSASPATNFNIGLAAQKLIVVSGNTGLIQFDLSSYPTNSVVSGAYPILPESNDHLGSPALRLVASSRDSMRCQTLTP
jgi:hypothetical protein